MSMIAMMLFAGLIAFVGLVIGGVVQKRPAVAISSVLPVLGVLVAVVLLYFLRAMPSAPTSQAVVWSGQFEPLSHDFSEARHVSGRLSFFSVFFIGAAVMAGVIALFRRRQAKAAGCGGGNWWPLFLLVPVLPVLLFMGTWRVHRSESVSSRQEAGRHFEIVQERVVREQAELMRRQAELAQRAMRFNDDMHHRIATMEIHKLMDMFDAPRIMLPMPAPATLATLAATAVPQASLIPPSPPQSARRLGSPDSAPAAVAVNSESSNEDAELIAEAKAAVESIVGEQPSGAAVTTSADQGSARYVMVAEAAPASAEKSPEAPTPVVENDWSDEKEDPDNESEELSTPIASRTTETEVQRERPNWVSHPPKRVGDVQREVLVTEEWSTEAECEQARDVGLMLKTYEHVQMLMGTPYAPHLSDYRMNSDHAWRDHRFNELMRAGITVDYLRREVAKDDYLETVERSVGPMKKLYTLVEFSPEIDRELRERWEAREREKRFWLVGGGASWVLGILGSIFALLKIDTWTKGYYTKRLFLGVPAAIIGLLGLLAVLLV